jgi:hypothetical protein
VTRFMTAVTEGGRLLGSMIVVAGRREPSLFGRPAHIRRRFVLTGGMPLFVLTTSSLR